MHSPVVLGMDFGGSKIAAAVCDIDGARLGSKTLPIRAVDGAQATLTRGIVAAHTLLGEVAPGRPLVAVGACTFGIPGEDRVDLAPTIPGWEDIAFGRELRRAFGGAQVRVVTDVKAAAYAESQWGALVECDPAIYLNLGTGLAVAIIANGAVLNGNNGAAGEIGYNLRLLSDVGLDLSSRTPLEEVVSGKALVRAAHELVPQARGTADVFAGAADDPQLARLFADLVAELSFHLVNLTLAIDPVRIAVGGGMMRSWGLLHDGLRTALDAAVPYPPQLVAAAFPFDAALIGALALSTSAARDVLSRAAMA